MESKSGWLIANENHPPRANFNPGWPLLYRHFALAHEKGRESALWASHAVVPILR